MSEPPNGGEYDKTKSYVIVKNNNGSLEYKVQLVEVKNGSTVGGVGEISREELYGDKATQKVVTSEISTIPSSIKYFWENSKNAVNTYEAAKSKIPASSTSSTGY